jgi:outer membrane protein W
MVKTACYADLNLFYKIEISKRKNMKKLFAVVMIMLSIHAVNAQRAGGFRYQMDFGAAIPKGGGIGVLVNMEPQILLKNNLVFGLRLGVAALAKDVTYYSIQEDYNGEVSANASIAGTLNYYFNKGNSRVAPYIGGGFGYYALSSVKIDDSDFGNGEVGNLEASFAWAPMVRAGVELGKFRIGAEYNFVPTSNLQNISGQVIGEAVNEYFGFTLGFFVGGGKWGK